MAMWALIWEIVMYAIFLYTVMMVAYGERDLLAFQTVKNNEAIFVTGRHVIDNDTNPTQFTSIANFDDFFDWAQTVFLPGLYPLIRGSDSLPFSSTNKYSTDEQGFLVGTSRFRQLRVKADSCKISSVMRNVISHCRAPYSVFEEDRNDYKTKWIPLDPNNTNDVADEYNTWKSMTELKMQPFMGLVATYWGGGYVADLGNTTTQAYQTVQDLYDNSWLDAFTRAVFIEFSLYYPAINMLCISQFLIEFLPSGGALTSPVFQVMRLDPYSGPNGIPVMVAEIMCCLFLLYFFYREVKKFRVEKKKYFFSFWNWMEVAVIALSITAIVMYAYRTIVRKDTIAFFEDNPNVYNNFAYPLLWEQIYGYMIYIILFIANIKFLRILRFNRRITAIVDTMQYGWQYMMAFFGTFFLIFMAFASASLMLFGNQLLDFMSFINTIETLCVIMIGVFNFAEFHDSSQFFGPLFFIVFIIVIQFILINMFLSIVNDAFAVVKHDLVHKSNEYELMDFVWFKFKNLFCASASVDPSFGEWIYMEEQDGYEQTMDEVRDKFDDLVFRLEDFVKDEKSNLPFDVCIDEDGAMKRRTYATE